MWLIALFDIYFILFYLFIYLFWYYYMISNFYFLYLSLHDFGGDTWDPLMEKFWEGSSQLIFA